jgi:hypothetical protein
LLPDLSRAQSVLDFAEEDVCFILGGFEELDNLKLLPIKIQLPMRSCTITQIQINQTLIWDAHIFGNCFEVRDGVFIESDRDLFFELCRVGIFLCL